MDGRVLMVVGAATFGVVAYLGVIGSGGLPVQTGASAEADVAAQAAVDRPSPETLVQEVAGQVVADKSIAATEHLKPVYVSDVIAGYRAPGDSEAPGDVVTLSSLSGCDLAGPAAGSRVANVFSNQTATMAPFFGWRQKDLEALAADAAKTATPDVRSDATASAGGFLNVFFGSASQPSLDRGLIDALRYSAMDVVVTETSVPVHLVLQTGHGRVLWNIHLASDARISGITLLGGDAPVVANAPVDVPVEVLETSALAACGLAPERAPLASDPIFAAVDAGELAVPRAEAELAERRARVEAWNDWFAVEFGVRSDETRIGYDGGATSTVVGPLPDAPGVPYRSLFRAPVAVPDGVSVLASAPADAAKALASLLPEGVTSINAAQPGDAVARLQ